MLHDAVLLPFMLFSRNDNQWRTTT